MFSIPTSKIGADINHIPPEILGEIFAHFLPLDSTPQKTQQALSSVCRLWRTLALATPALWASLDITCNFDAQRPPLPAIPVLLQRSQAHPLSFVLHAGKSSRKHGNPHLLPVLKALTAARQRWHNVYIELNNMTGDVLDLITQGDAPLLRSIRCDITESPPPWLRVPLSMVHCCPHLESFRWHSTNSPLLLPLGITQLTLLSLEVALSVSECITILNLSPRLCSATFRDITRDRFSPIPHLIHPALCALTATGERFPALLATLTLPALLDLNLTIESAEWEIQLSAFLERSQPTLRKLSLSMTHMDEPALLRILALTPHLHNLALSSFSPRHRPLFTAAIVHALHPSPTPGIVLCPHLQKLNLSWVSDCPDGLCTAMLYARRGARARANRVACLEEVHVQFVGGRHKRDQAYMKKLCVEGMQGELRCEDNFLM